MVMCVCMYVRVYEFKYQRPEVLSRILKRKENWIRHIIWGKTMLPTVIEGTVKGEEGGRQKQLNTVRCLLVSWFPVF